jgi:hypothetical protein
MIESPYPGTIVYGQFGASYSWMVQKFGEPTKIRAGRCPRIEWVFSGKHGWTMLWHRAATDAVLHDLADDVWWHISSDNFMAASSVLAMVPPLFPYQSFASQWTDRGEAITAAIKSALKRVGLFSEVIYHQGKYIVGNLWIIRPRLNGWEFWARDEESAPNSSSDLCLAIETLFQQDGNPVHKAPAIDAGTVCAWCGIYLLVDRVSEDFCSEPCQSDWYAKGCVSNEN